MPFAGGIDSQANGTLLFAFTAAFLYLLIVGRPPSWRRTVAKTASVTLLAVLAALEGGPVLLVAALALSALGDAFLAHDGERAFVGGLTSFLAAHIVYVLLFAFVGGGLEILSVQPWRLALPALATLASFGLLARLLPAVDGPLRGPVSLYMFAILAMMWTSSTVPVPIVMVGALLFLVSDAMLAVEKLLLAPASPHRQWTAPSVWVLYWLAQATITLGFLL